MNNIKTLQEILNIVYLADKELLAGSPLYKVKALFDDLNLNGFIEFSTNYGELIQLVLDAKRKDVAAVNIIRARSVLQETIKRLESQQIKLDEEQQEKDNLAIDCTFITVTDNEIAACTTAIAYDFKETQLQLDNMPKKLGRPKKANALTGAQRAKRARDKKKTCNLVVVNSTLSKLESRLYIELTNKGLDLNCLIRLAYAQHESGRVT